MLGSFFRREWVRVALRLERRAKKSPTVLYKGVRKFFPRWGGWSLDGGENYRAAFRPERRTGNQSLDVDQLIKFAVDGTDSGAT